MFLSDNLLQERPELFLKEGTVRPGILVLVNDADWELLGQQEYEIEQGDTILFISTLLYSIPPITLNIKYTFFFSLIICLKNRTKHHR